MTETTESTHSPWCPEGRHVEDETIHFFIAVAKLYTERTGRDIMPTRAVFQTTELLLTVLEDAADEAEAEDVRAAQKEAAVTP